MRLDVEQSAGADQRKKCHRSLVPRNQKVLPVVDGVARRSIHKRIRPSPKDRFLFKEENGVVA